LGHRALTAIPSSLNSSAIPRTHIDIPYLAIVYAKNKPYMVREKSQKPLLLTPSKKS